MYKILILFLWLSALFGLEIRPKLGLGYDTNPWSISGDEADFPIELEGDAFSTIEIDSDIRFFRLSGWSLRGAFDVKYKGYAQNARRGYLSVAPKVTAITKGYWVSLSYGYIPRYTIRPVKDKDDGYAYKFPEYSVNEFLLRTAWSPFGDLWIEGRGEYQLNYYDINFLEYDQNQWSVGGYLRWDGGIYAKAGYRFTNSKSQAIDTQGESIATSDDTDGSYDEDRFYVRLGRDFGDFDAYISGTHYQRYYTSEKGYDDPIHYTRKDIYRSINLDLGYDLGKVGLGIKLGYSDRDAESRINPDMPMLRSYEAWDGGIYIEYNSLEIE